MLYVIVFMKDIGYLTTDNQVSYIPKDFDSPISADNTVYDSKDEVMKRFKEIIERMKICLDDIMEITELVIKNHQSHIDYDCVKYRCKENAVYHYIINSFIRTLLDMQAIDPKSTNRSKTKKILILNNFGLKILEIKTEYEEMYKRYLNGCFKVS